MSARIFGSALMETTLVVMKSSLIMHNALHMFSAGHVT